jgi:hypothetical protein
VHRAAAGATVTETQTNPGVREKTCSCCDGWESFPFACSHCDKLVHRIDENWVRFDIMHGDRIGYGTVQTCSMRCALFVLASIDEKSRAESPIAYRSEGYTLMPGCHMRAHYDQIQALCDALGFAAQEQQGAEVQKVEQHQRRAGKLLADFDQRDAYTAARAAHEAEKRAEYQYGLFQGYRGLLRALEGNTGELTPREQELMQRIDWDAERPHFRVPGFDHVRIEDQHLPGEGSGEAAHAANG